MALTLEPVRHGVADILGRSPSDIPVDENLLDHGLDSVRIMTLLERRRRNHAVDADSADLPEQPSIDVWAPLLEAS
ncbi:phosphopantetheine-binding protein [Streptomyces sp. NPDC048565]|uniref:phosphopantetheine-binding protein n=1 Tax=Streptomyces sp. NPDC048565 TaxID=3155266 RepID=UPI003444614B